MMKGVQVMGLDTVIGYDWEARSRSFGWCADKEDGREMSGVTLNRSRYLVIIFVVILVLIPILASPAPLQGKLLVTQSAEWIAPDGQVGGLTDAVAARGKIVYLGVGPRLVIVDLDRIETLSTFDDIKLGQTEPFGDIVRDVVLEGVYAYVAAGRAGLRIVDISDPASPREVGALNVTEDAVAIDNTGTTIYLGDYGPSGLHVIDAGDPTAPRELGSADWRAGIWSIMVNGDYAYVADGYDLFIFDVSDPAAPRQIGHVGTACSALDAVVVGTTVYVADHSNCGLLVADVSDPTINTSIAYSEPEEAHYLNPRLESRDQHETVLVEAAGDYIYVVNRAVEFRNDGDHRASGRLTVFDVVNHDVPLPVGRFNLDRDDPYKNITDMVVDGNRAYLSYEHGGLYVVDLSDLRLSNNVARIPTLGPVVGIAADGGRVLAADPKRINHGYEYGLDRNRTLLGIPVEGGAREWEGVGGLGFLTKSDSITVVDIHGFDPIFGPRPTEVGSYAVPHRPFMTAVGEDSFLLFYEKDDQLTILNATNPLDVWELGEIAIPDPINDDSIQKAFAGSELAVLTYWDSPPWMVDLQDEIAAPLGQLGSQPASDVAIVGDVVYVVAKDKGVARYDVADRSSPRTLGWMPGLESAYGVHRDGSLLFVGLADGSIHVFDTTTAEPATVAVLDAPYEMVSASRMDGRVYVAAGDSGLWSYSLDDLPGVGASAAPVTTFDNLPPSESLLLYIDENEALVMEDVSTGMTAQLAEGERVSSFSIAPTRDRIVYIDVAGASRVIDLDFQSDGRLSVERLPGQLPSRATRFVWSPTAERVAVQTANRSWDVYDPEGIASPIPMIFGTVSFGGWSYDGQWVSYCTEGGTLGIIDITGAYQTVAEGVACSTIFGDSLSWSPTKLQLAYVRKDGLSIDTTGFQPAVYDMATNAHYGGPTDHVILEWSFDGRFLALANGFAGNKGFTFETVTIIQPGSSEMLAIGPFHSASFGKLGWREEANVGFVFNNLRISDDLSAAEPIMGNVIDISADGSRWITGEMEGETLHVYCGPPDDLKQSLLLTTTKTIYPDEHMAGAESGAFAPGVTADMSPTGRFLTLRSYQGENDWLTEIMPCHPDTPLPNRGQTVWNGFAGANFSAVERYMILKSWKSGGVDRRDDLYDTAKTEAEPVRALSGDVDSYQWLITDNAAPAVGAPAPGAAPSIGHLLDRLEAAIGQLESTTYETSGGVIYPEPIPAFDQTAAHRLLGDLRAADPMTITPEQAEALERLVLQEEALVILLDDYTILTNDLADVKADLAGMVVGVVLLKEQVRRDLAKAILELALKAIQDFIKLWLFAIEDEELRESARNVIEDLPLLITAATQDVDAGLEEFVDRAIGDGVRAVAASMFISDLADAVQPAVDQGVRTVQSGDEPVWPVESNSEVASIQMDGLTTQSGIMRELAHDVYVNSLMRGRDVNALLTDIADIFTLGLRARIAAIYSIQTRIHQILIDTAANSVLSGAMTCTRDAAVDSGEYAFQPDRPGYGCEVPVPLDLRDFFDRLLGEGPRRSYAGRLAPPAQSSAPEFDAALLAYGAAVEGLRAAVAAGDAAAVRARADELLPAAQTLDSAAVPLVARLTAETGISEGEMALGVALTLVRLDAFFALLAAEAYLADPAVADTETFNDVLGKAEENTVLLERVRAQVPLPLTPAAALPMIDAPATWDAVVGQPLDIPVTVANLGGAPFAAARLIVAVDGQMINETPLPDVAPDTSTTVSPTFTPERLGPHDLRLVVTVGERSDYRTVALNVVEALAEAAESGSTEGDSAEDGAAPDDGSERDSAAAQGWIRAVLLGVMGVSGVVFVVGLALVITRRRRG